MGNWRLGFCRLGEEEDRHRREYSDRNLERYTDIERMGKRERYKNVVGSWVSWLGSQGALFLFGYPISFD